MNINYKLVAGFAAFAFVFSFFSGLISGNDFLVVLLRSCLGGLGFALLGAGVGYVIDKFLPEIWPSENQSGEDERAGSADDVDITLPEENPHGRNGYFAADELGDEPDLGSRLDEINRASGRPAADTETDPEAAGRARRKPVAGRTANEDAMEAEQGDGAEDSEDTGAEDVESAMVAETEAENWDAVDLESLPGMAAGGRKEKKATQKPKQAANSPDAAPEELKPAAAFESLDIDSLPSIEAFESSFPAVEPSEDQIGTDSHQVDNIYKAAPGASQKNINVTGHEHNPDEAAKAIRTWLKKDKEG